MWKLYKPTSQLHCKSALTCVCHGAHALCTTITGLELPYLVFEEHVIDGSTLVTMDERDFEELFKIAQVRHRLLHCIHHTAQVSAPELLSNDFLEAE